MTAESAAEKKFSGKCCGSSCAAAVERQKMEGSTAAAGRSGTVRLDVGR